MNACEWHIYILPAHTQNIQNALCKQPRDVEIELNFRSELRCEKRIFCLHALQRACSGAELTFLTLFFAFEIIF